MRERGRGREILSLLYALSPGAKPTTQVCALTKNQSVTFHFAGRHQSTGPHGSELGLHSNLKYHGLKSYYLGTALKSGKWGGERKNLKGSGQLPAHQTAHDPFGL